MAYRLSAILPKVYETLEVTDGELDVEADNGSLLASMMVKYLDDISYSEALAHREVFNLETSLETAKKQLIDGMVPSTDWINTHAERLHKAKIDMNDAIDSVMELGILRKHLRSAAENTQA